jgi:hypothetical protein
MVGLLEDDDELPGFGNHPLVRAREIHLMGGDLGNEFGEVLEGGHFVLLDVEECL